MDETNERIHQETFYLILQKSVGEGKFPESLKEAEIIPIYKSKEKSALKNYCLVSLTSNKATIFKRIIRKEVVNHLESKELLNNDHTSSGKEEAA